MLYENFNNNNKNKNFLIIFLKGIQFQSSSAFTIYLFFTFWANLKKHFSNNYKSQDTMPRAPMFWNVLFEGAILKGIYVLKCIFWGSNLEEHLCPEMYSLREQLSTFTAKSYPLINMLFYHWLCGSVAKRIENVAINTLSLWWREFESLEEQIFCNCYGRMKVYSL